MMTMTPMRAKMMSSVIDELLDDDCRVSEFAAPPSSVVGAAVVVAQNSHITVQSEKTHDHFDSFTTP